MTIPTPVPLDQIPANSGLSQDDLIALARHAIEEQGISIGTPQPGMTRPSFQWYSGVPNE